LIFKLFLILLFIFSSNRLYAKIDIKYYIQVSALFKSNTPDNIFVNRLKYYNYSYILIKKNNSTAVLIGSFNSKQSATKALIAIRKNINPQSFIYKYQQIKKSNAKVTKKNLKKITQIALKNLEYISVEKKKNGIKLLEEASKLGYGNATMILAFLYYQGEDVKQDIQKALLYLNLAILQNMDEADYILGTIYLDGEIVKRDINRATLHLQKASKSLDESISIKAKYLIKEYKLNIKDLIRNN